MAASPPPSQEYRRCRDRPSPRTTRCPAGRAPDGPEFDVFLWGTVFLDIVFTGLASMPANGTEVWADGMGSCPGGIANLAIASSRLGLRTSLAAAFGDDDYADFCWRTLEEQERVDLRRSRRFEQLALAGDRLAWRSTGTGAWSPTGTRRR